MKKIVCFLCVIVLFACNDGDIIVSNFDYSAETELQLCGVNEINVLHNVNSETSEAISFEFELNNFTGRFEGLCPPESVIIPLNLTNKVTYRKLSENVDGEDYFCQQIPPASPNVIEEFTSLNGGEAELIFFTTGQDDGDGVPAFEEDLNGDGNLFNDDTDSDGIPDFLDTDDDNDNVPTAVEIINNENPDEYPDFDDDGIPDYLDEDDDGDGIISRYEDLNAFDELDDDGNPILNPRTATNEAGIPNYLNPDATEELVIDLYRPNTISRTFRVQIVLSNVSLVRDDGEQTITLSSLTLGNYTASFSNEELPMTFEPAQACN